MWLRRSVASTAALLMACMGVMPAVAAADNAPATLAFIDKAFNNNEIQLYGSAEFGVTIEALMARKAGGYSLVKQLPAIKHVFTERSTIGYNKAGYLYAKDGSLRVGRTGMFLFASKALGVANGPLQNIFYGELKQAIASDGSIKLANGNGVEYAWVVLGLHAYKQDSLALKVLAYLESKQNADGGIPGWSSSSSTDATGLALQAESLLRAQGGSKAVGQHKTAISRAVAFLRKQAIDGNHWQVDNGDGSFSDDVNGSAYAAMGLKAVGMKIDGYSAWFKTQLASDGGLKSAWSGAEGDVFATVQAYTPLIGKSYIDLLSGK